MNVQAINMPHKSKSIMQRFTLPACVNTPTFYMRPGFRKAINSRRFIFIPFRSKNEYGITLLQGQFKRKSETAFIKHSFDPLECITKFAAIYFFSQVD